MNKREELIKILKEEANKIETENNNSQNEVWNSKEIKLNGETEFKHVQPVGSWRRYHYYISNLGRVIVVKTDNPEDIKKTVNLSDLKPNKDFCFIQIDNGYLKDSVLKIDNNEIKLTTTTDVYKFMVEAGWLDDDEGKESKDLSVKIVNNNINKGTYDRLEVHHIDNNPSNNNKDNLIWLPKTIHQHQHNSK